MSWMNLNFQNSNSPLMEQLIFFHDHSMLILLLITIFVSYLMISMIFNKLINKFLISNQLIEIIWTILPSIILLFIAFPSLRLLYLIDDNNQPLISVKAIGNQWYWNYEIENFKKIEFDSYMKKENKIIRLLEVDNNLIIPYNFQTKMIISSIDVLHSWTIPSLGVKIDATPGRLNQTSFFIKRPGKFFGQCSEICGMNHSFMPILLESCNLKMFLNYLKN